MKSIKRKNFTILELLIVITIIIILLSLTIVAAQNFITKGKLAQVRMDLAKIAGGIEKYKTTYGVYPYVGDGTRSVNAGDPRHDDSLGTNPAENAIITFDQGKYTLAAKDNDPLNKDHKRNPRKIRYIESYILTPPFPGMIYRFAVNYKLDGQLDVSPSTTWLKANVTPSTAKDALDTHKLLEGMGQQAVAGYVEHPIDSVLKPVTTWGN